MIGVKSTRSIFCTMFGVWLEMGIALIGIRVKLSGAEECREPLPSQSTAPLLHNDTLKTENVLCLWSFKSQNIVKTST